ncbi:hypothetical protein C1645_750932 [Glomus cerebriforme]|uniref:Myb-like domain-containing protein n=1 Tax=Glomus cerebriforme TaxID=658196 RepID=A0A397TNA7_9GLOM|nr:hypothetical protein C1645_750932 [Glomus cerebriforme]
MTELNQNTYISTGKQVDNIRQDRRKTRQKWGAAETSLLVEGLFEHGVGNWKKILTDPKYPFGKDRTAVDLKDRFRTLYPNEYENLYGKKAKRKTKKTNNDQSMVTFEKKPHRPKNKFTPEEDNSLKLGIEKYGNSWSKIAGDQQFNLMHRRGQDLRDRCRVAYPEIYARFSKSRKSKHVGKSDPHILKKFYALPFQITSPTIQEPETSNI